jgi:hypothetical protein
VDESRLSGEPQVPQLKDKFSRAPFSPYLSLDFYNTPPCTWTTTGKDANDYWLSSFDRNETGEQILKPLSGIEVFADQPI